MLAAMSFGDPIMLLGLLAAGIPVVLHLLNRIRSPIVPFPTLRFLKITAQKTSRRRQLQHWLLLLLRMMVFGLVAMLVGYPLIRGGSPALAYSFLIMLLVGAALLALAVVLATAALENRQVVPATPTAEEILGHAPAARRASPLKGWALTALMLLAGVLLAGYATFGLGSSYYFSGDKGVYSGRSTACVIILDNSHSMLARQDSASRLQKAKEQVRQLLVNTLRPAKVAVLATNPGTTEVPADLSGDLTATLGYVDKLETLGRAQPMKQLIRQAMKLFAGAEEPNKMLIILSDYARPAFADAEIFSGIKENAEGGGGGGGKELQVVLMPQGVGAPPADVGITGFTIASGQPVLGSEIVFEAQILNNGDPSVGVLQLAVDDVPVPGAQVQVQLGKAGDSVTKSIAYRLTKPGWHRFAATLRDQTDAMTWDNQRQLVLNVANQMKVLIIGPEPAVRARTTAYYVEAALDPFRGMAAPTVGPGSDKGAPTWGIVPTYAGVDLAAGQTLTGYSAIFLCDVPKIPPTLAESLSKFVRGGGRMINLLGPSVDAAAYNAELGGARELLPGNLGSPVVTASGNTVDWVQTESDVFKNLFDSQEPFRSIVVTGRWTLAGAKADRGRALSKLDDNSPFMAQHVVGRGEVYTIFSAPSGGWSNMATTVPFLPLMSRMAMGDAGRIRAELAYEPTQVVELGVVSDDVNYAVDVTTPRRETVNIHGSSAGISPPRWVFGGSPRTLYEGVYTWQSLDRKQSGMFVVNPPADEVDLLPADVDALAMETGTPHPAIVAPTAADLMAHLDKQAEGTPLTPGLLAIVLILVVGEALLANRYRPALRTSSVELPSAGPVPPIAAAPNTRSAA